MYCIYHGAVLAPTNNNTHEGTRQLKKHRSMHGSKAGASKNVAPTEPCTSRVQQTEIRQVTRNEHQMVKKIATLIVNDIMLTIQRYW